MEISKKHYVSKKSDIGKNGPGQYIFEGTKTDSRGKPMRKVVTVTGEHDPVDQAQAHLTEIDNLLEPARKKGLLDAVTKFEGEMDDIPVADFEQAMNTVVQAQTMFDAMPHEVRTRFANDPSKFLEFVNNPDNAQEMMSMGLIKGNDGKTRTGAPSGAPTDLNNDGQVDTVDTNADGIPDAN
jgi:phage internal scaffolding protein